MPWSSNARIQPSTTSQPVSMDPSAPGTIVRRAMAVEAFFNVLGAAGMIFIPHTILSFMTAPSAKITPLATSLTQLLGAVVLALTTPLLLCLPDTRRGVESRTTVYWTVMAGEVCLVLTFLWQLVDKGEESGFTKLSLTVSAVQLGALVGWRLWVLLKRPEWFGRYSDVKKE